MSVKSKRTVEKITEETDVKLLEELEETYEKLMKVYHKLEEVLIPIEEVLIPLEDYLRQRGMEYPWLNPPDDSEESDDLDDALTELDIIRKDLSNLVKKQWLYKYKEEEIEKILLDMSERIQKCIDKLEYSDCTCVQFPDAEPPRKEDWDDYEISIPML